MKTLMTAMLILGSISAQASISKCEATLDTNSGKKSSQLQLVSEDRLETNIQGYDFLIYFQSKYSVLASISRRDADGRIEGGATVKDIPSRSNEQLVHNWDTTGASAEIICE